MKKTRKKVWISLLLVCNMLIQLTGCANKENKIDLMENIIDQKVEALDKLDSQNAFMTDFAIRLFQTSAKERENTLISPLSVISALAMTANGASGATLEQMEKMFGIDIEELNMYLYSYRSNLPQGDKYKLNIANSIWFNKANHFVVNEEFLQANANYYDAEIHESLFDEQTCEVINKWVKEKTEEMIPEILDQIPSDAMMYLINALTFEAEWETIYYKNQVKKGVFTTEDGIKQEVEFMNGREGIYLSDDMATGFMKYYKDGKYAFVAMQPNEGVSISDYIASLDGESLNHVLNNPEKETVSVSIPKFQVEYDVEMSDILKSMGMTDAFDMTKANFQNIGVTTEGKMFISRVLHKTFIAVGEIGTKAGAVTVVESNYSTAMPDDLKEVYLDRPFIYMLIDCKNNIPFFIGTMMDMENNK